MAIQETIEPPSNSSGERPSLRPVHVLALTVFLMASFAIGILAGMKGWLG